jgi:DNA-binding transcriptional MerR regulator
MGVMGTRAMSGRSYLSIGDVLSLLREEFPDVTISKIRFLESQGLVDPERSPSGYRKFYDDDVARLRWVLRKQRDQFLPLKVIRDRLAAAGNGAPVDPEPADSAEIVEVRSGEGAAAAGGGEVADAVVGPSGQASNGTAESSPAGGRGDDPRGVAVVDERPEPTAAVQAARRPEPAAAVQGHQGELSAARVPLAPSPLAVSPPGQSPLGQSPLGQSPPGQSPLGQSPLGQSPLGQSPLGQSPPGQGGLSPSVRPGQPVGAAHEERSAHEVGPAPAKGSAPDAPGGLAGGLAPSVSSVSLTLAELCAATGLTPEAVASLESFGLLAPMAMAGGTYYDEEALTVGKLVVEFSRYGVEPRHLRMYRNAADRELGLVEQVITPLLRQRNPEARQRAVDAATDLARLGQALRASLVRAELRRKLGT